MSASDSSAFFSNVPDMISSWNLVVLTGAFTVLIMYNTVTGGRFLVLLASPNKWTGGVAYTSTTPLLSSPWSVNSSSRASGTWRKSNSLEATTSVANLRFNASILTPGNVRITCRRRYSTRASSCGPVGSSRSEGNVLVVLVRAQALSDSMARG
ncbi:hypothetical protein DVH05_019138 [Phytophthora capsici]|nr:hypothetical protein DVH05_019138 [Phytophthora capsici]